VFELSAELINEEDGEGPAIGGLADVSKAADPKPRIEASEALLLIDMADGL
jgi:hypothetical protein